MPGTLRVVRRIAASECGELGPQVHPVLQRIYAGHLDVRGCR